MAEYDAIGDRYSEAKQAPWRIHLEAYTLERLAGDIRGAAAVLGVDVSEEMVGLARRAEAAAPAARFRTATGTISCRSRRVRHSPR